MTSKQNVLIAVAVLLAGFYVYFFTDWINRPRIQILAQTRPVRPRRQTAQTYPVNFTLDGDYSLTSVKVVLLSAYETNKFAPPLWHLVAYTNATPTHGFLYGGRLPGLRPRLTNSRPETLKPDTMYRLFVEAGRARGQIDFRTSGPIETGN
jgi:hypothetical protein